MPKYIDPIDLKKAIKGVDWIAAQLSNDSDDVKKIIGFLEWIIDHMPTADVQEVKHGKWINELGMCRCSECGNRDSYYSMQFDYCRNCGAKMNEKENKDGRDE